MGVVEKEPSYISRFQPLAESRQELLLPYEETIIDKLLSCQEAGVGAASILVKFAMAYPVSQHHSEVILFKWKLFYNY